MTSSSHQPGEVTMLSKPLSRDEVERLHPARPALHRLAAKPARQWSRATSPPAAATPASGLANLYCNINNIRVRSFILTGAPAISIVYTKAAGTIWIFGQILGSKRRRTMTISHARRWADHYSNHDQACPPRRLNAIFDATSDIG
jgi:hypothetical protein